MLFNELPFLDRFAAAKAAGFTGVEYLFPYDFEKAVLGEQLQQHGLTQVLHNLPAENWAAGERGIAILPDRTSEFRDGVKRAIEYAKALGCRQVNCLAGIAPAGAGPAELHAVFVENLRYAAAALSKQAIQIISEVGSENLFVQYDIYHMQIMEGDLAPTMKKHLDHTAHIELADNPGRNEPGTGEINYPFLFRYLDEIGYRGSIGCEYKPKTTTMEGFGWYEPHTVDA